MISFAVAVELTEPAETLVDSLKVVVRLLRLCEERFL